MFSIENHIKECKQCLFTNEIDSSLVINSNGLCNHCVEYERKKIYINEHELSSDYIQNRVNRIKSEAQSKYDCLIGISGGVDSTYLALKVKEMGLNPLAVHFDNGWNSELAIINIENIVKTLGFDLYTYVVDWDEFKDLQLAYLKASVVDVEAITDQAITAIMFKLAKKYRIKHIISGENFRTEGTLPQSWVYIKSDHRNIRDIHKKYGKLKLKTYPILGYFKRIIWSKVLKFEYWRLLDEIPYEKTIAKKEIIDKLKWRDYGGKHYESVFTRFYQSFILPYKFNIDKRVSHYSTLICAGQLSKQEAIELLKEPTCDVDILEEDKIYFRKKFRLSDQEYDEIMNASPKSHLDYKNIYQVLKLLKPFKAFIPKRIVSIE